MTTTTGGPEPRHRARWLVRLAAVVALAALATATALPASADPAPSAERRLVELINTERSRNGLAHLTVAGDITGVARQWSTSMAGTGQLAHNPAFGTQICCWVTVGENVAQAGPISGWPNLTSAMGDVHAELMASSSHRANILDPAYREVGVGVVIVGNHAWVTQNFRQPHTESTPEPDEPADEHPDRDPHAADRPDDGPDTDDPAADRSDDGGAGRIVLDEAAARLDSTYRSDDPDRQHPVRGLVSRQAVAAPEAVATVLARIDERRSDSQTAPPRHPVAPLLEHAASAAG